MITYPSAAIGMLMFFVLGFLWGYGWGRRGTLAGYQYELDELNARRDEVLKKIKELTRQQ